MQQDLKPKLRRVCGRRPASNARTSRSRRAHNITPNRPFVGGTQSLRPMEIAAVVVVCPECHATDPKPRVTIRPGNVQHLLNRRIGLT